MSLVVNHNLMAANVARNLNAHYANLSNSTQRLSTGLRINSAADDAAGLAIRELQRADIAALHQGARNANDAISLIQVADGALQIIDEKLIRMKELAEQAATGTYDSTQRMMIESEYQAMASEITRIANATDFNGMKLLDGTLESDEHNGSKLQSEGKMKIHFGTGNASAEDYYYIQIEESTSQAFGVGDGSTWEDASNRIVKAFENTLVTNLNNFYDNPDYSDAVKEQISTAAGVKGANWVSEFKETLRSNSMFSNASELETLYNKYKDDEGVAALRDLFEESISDYNSVTYREQNKMEYALGSAAMKDSSLYTFTLDGESLALDAAGNLAYSTAAKAASAAATAATVAQAAQDAATPAKNAGDPADTNSLAAKAAANATTAQGNISTAISNANTASTAADVAVTNSTKAMNAASSASTAAKAAISALLGKSGLTAIGGVTYDIAPSGAVTGATAGTSVTLNNGYTITVDSGNNLLTAVDSAGNTITFGGNKVLTVENSAGNIVTFGASGAGSSNGNLGEVTKFDDAASSPTYSVFFDNAGDGSGSGTGAVQKLVNDPGTTGSVITFNGTGTTRSNVTKFESDATPTYTVTFDNGAVDKVTIGSTGPVTTFDGNGIALENVKQYEDDTTPTYTVTFSSGSVETHTDSSGNVTTFNGGGSALTNVKSVKDTDGNVIGFSSGNVVSVKDVAGNIISFNGGGTAVANVTSIQDKTGAKFNLVNDGTDIKSVTDGSGNTYSISWTTTTPKSVSAVEDSGGSNYNINWTSTTPKYVQSIYQASTGNTTSFDINGNVTGITDSSGSTISSTPAQEAMFDILYDAFTSAETDAAKRNYAGFTVATQEDAQNALVAITDAIEAKDKIRARIGALQNRLENTISNLNIQAENLQAAESRISDVDVSTEMTEFVRQQILTQSAVAMLSQANSLPQMAMQLIGG